MGYNVYRAESPTGAKQLLNPTPIHETCYEDRAVQRDHTYYYVVRAVAADGSLSAPSNEATAPITLTGRAGSHQQPAGATRGESHVHHGTNAAAKR
jgi:fibronectin type 3 domain-containing protein